MGKAVDSVIAIFLLIIGFYALNRMGITLPIVEKSIKSFFFSSSTSSTNATASLLIGMSSMSNSKKKEKVRKQIESLLRSIKMRRMKTEVKDQMKGEGR